MAYLCHANLSRTHRVKKAVLYHVHHVHRDSYTTQAEPQCERLVSQKVGKSFPEEAFQWCRDNSGKSTGGISQHSRTEEGHSYAEECPSWAGNTLCYCSLAGS